MNIKHIKILSAGSVILLVALIVAIGFKIQFSFRSLFDDQENGENGRHYVAIITKATTSAYWKSVFAGANAAKSEYNLDITMEGPDDEEDWETQNEIIQRAVDNGAEVIILSAVDYTNNIAAVDNAVASGTKVVIIDSDVNSSKVSCRISTDNYQAGRMAGEALLAGDEDMIYVGIVNFDEVTANGQQREQGFRDSVKDNDRVRIADAINVNSNIASAKSATMEMLSNHPQMNAIVTFNEWTSLGVGYAIQELGLGDATRVIAFDSNVISVGMLETGEVDGLIVQNPYAMGYLGVETAFKLINNYALSSENIDTTTTLVTRDNMFDNDIQRTLFVFD